MTGDLVYAWDDRLQRKVCIGVATWDGRELLPDRSERRDPRFVAAGGDGDASSRQARLAARQNTGTVCRCGGRKSEQAVQCRRCVLGRAA